jgi:hypothetical protein
MVTLTHEGSYVGLAAKSHIAAALAEPSPESMPKPSTGY